MRFPLAKAPPFLHRRSIAKAPCTTTRTARTTGIRHLHRATAEFTHRGVDGKLLTSTESIWVDDPEDAFVMIPREVGDGFSRLLGGRSGDLTLDGATGNTRLPLVFYYDRKCFFHESLPEYPPCLKVPVDLPRQQLEANHVSPATLYLYGLMYTIALDGTDDDALANQRECRYRRGMSDLRKLTCDIQQCPNYLLVTTDYAEYYVQTNQNAIPPSKRLQRLHITWINPHNPLSQPGMLESAVHSPINLEHYSKQRNPFQLAADLSEKAMRNHAYMDGNKRTALVAADMFMKINGYRLQLLREDEDEDRFAVNGELADAQVAVVTGEWSRERLGRCFESRWLDLA